MTKKVYKDKIINIDEDLFNNKFLFDYLYDIESKEDIEIIFMSEKLKQRENKELFKNLGDKYSMYSNVYSPKDELEIFIELFENAIKNNKKIHIIWITLKEEIEILEEYYTKLWFLREDVNCFTPDFWKPLVTVSVKIENLIWKGSDYKAQKQKIFFIPPIRESGQNKAMFKWINKWIIAWIYIENFSPEIEKFLTYSIKNESILPLTLAKILYYNYLETWFTWTTKELVISY